MITQLVLALAVLSPGQTPRLTVHGPVGTYNVVVPAGATIVWSENSVTISWGGAPTPGPGPTPDPDDDPPTPTPDPVEGPLCSVLVLPNDPAPSEAFLRTNPTLRDTLRNLSCTFNSYEVGESDIAALNLGLYVQRVGTPAFIVLNQSGKVVATERVTTIDGMISVVKRLRGQSAAPASPSAAPAPPNDPALAPPLTPSATPQQSTDDPTPDHRQPAR